MQPFEITKGALKEKHYLPILARLSRVTPGAPIPSEVNGPSIQGR